MDRLDTLERALLWQVIAMFLQSKQSRSVLLCLILLISCDNFFTRMGFHVSATKRREWVYKDQFLVLQKWM